MVNVPKGILHVPIQNLKWIQGWLSKKIILDGYWEAILEKLPAAGMIKVLFNVCKVCEL